MSGFITLKTCIKTILGHPYQKCYDVANLVACFSSTKIRGIPAATQQRNTNLSGLNYCMSLVERNDYENYLCTLLLDDELRRHAFALRAFNVEVSKCVQSVSEEHIAKMKLKFWYDSVDKCFAQDRSYINNHPVLNELKHTIERNKLSKIYLKRLITARSRPFNEQFLTVHQLEEYAEQSFSSLYYLLVELCDIKNMNVDHAISHLGKAQGITNLLRSIPYKRRNEVLYLPQEILLKHGVSQERIERIRGADKGVEDCVFEIATVAFQHLEKARSLSDMIPQTAKKLFLPAVAVERYLERLRSNNFRLTDPRCMRRDSLLPLALYWRKIRGRF